MKKILIYIVLALVAVCAMLTVSLRKSNSEKERFNANQTALLSKVDYFTTKSNKNAAEVLKLTLTADELKKSNERLKRIADDLGIKLKRAQSALTTGVRTEVKIVTQVKDSLIYRDSIIAPVKMFDWRDAWVSVAGVIERDSVDLSVASVDTLTTIVHKIPHKFLFIKWGCKAIKQTVVSSNPHTRITYTEYIEVK